MSETPPPPAAEDTAETAAAGEDNLFKSFLRNEASFSVLLELAVSDLQDEIEDQIKVAETTDR